MTLGQPLSCLRVSWAAGAACVLFPINQLAELHSRNKPRVKLLRRWCNGGGPKVSLGCTGQPEKRTGGRAAPASDKLAYTGWSHWAALMDRQPLVGVDRGPAKWTRRKKKKYATGRCTARGACPSRARRRRRRRRRRRPRRATRNTTRATPRRRRVKPSRRPTPCPRPQRCSASAARGARCRRRESRRHGARSRRSPRG